MRYILKLHFEENIRDILERRNYFEKDDEILIFDDGNMKTTDIKEEREFFEKGNHTKLGNSKLWINMDEHMGEFLPIGTDKPCWWCREYFKTVPIGCPINYDSKCETFETIGIFCSFQCTKSYIISNGCRGRFVNSCQLLTILSEKLLGKKIKIVPSPPIEIMEKWGGHLSHDQYKKSMEFVSYTITESVKRNLMRPVGILIEEKRIQ